MTFIHATMNIRKEKHLSEGVHSIALINHKEKAKKSNYMTF